MQATPDIELRVAIEVARASEILITLNAENVVSSPYLISAIYYHDGFLRDFPVDRNTADPERRIIAQISHGITPQRKAEFVRVLQELWARSEAAGPATWAQPVAYSAAGGGRRTHRYAVDLFAPEGAAVHAVSRGIVVLADRDWSPEDLFSTTSRNGGNAVIVFDPDHERFYRYCHLGTVDVSAGEAVAADQVVGTVGHTGLNASQAGHGGHLHFEANEYGEGHVRAMDNKELRAMLRRGQATPAATTTARARTKAAGRRGRTKS